ncbi:MAG: cytochrome-c peroxidase [Verrucomicrobia bacterium]|nr:cytochrome-c peroxidase [Verrucomicrobiota bacterium]
MFPEKIALGRKLFFDPILSRNGSVSCSSCHLPEHGFGGDGPLPTGIDGGKGRRNAPSLLNRAYAQSLFWDGRVPTLEVQALEPIRNPTEMGASVEEVVKRLRTNRDYSQAFAAVFEDGVSPQNIAKAMASFERTLLTGHSAVDRFRNGDVSALTDSARHGLWLFESRGLCWKCHSGRNFTDEKFHNTGVSWGKAPLDLGRFEVSGKEEDRGRFKTPTLRQAARTAPYMHDGSLATLREVVEFYNHGGTSNPNLDPIMRPLNLSENDIRSLVSFLESLTGKVEAGADGATEENP